MKELNLVNEDMDTRYVEYRNKENNILMTRFERIKLEHGEPVSYLYSIYIFRKDLKKKRNGKVGEYNIICFNKSYETFGAMVKNLDSILQEYFLDNRDVIRCMELVGKLDPKQYW